jgi:hypothetical protein
MKAQNFDSLNNFDRSIEEGLNWANKKREFANKNTVILPILASTRSRTSPTVAVP